MERVQKVVTPIGNLALVTMVHPHATTNDDVGDPLVSSDEDIL